MIGRRGWLAIEKALRRAPGAGERRRGGAAPASRRERWRSVTVDGVRLACDDEGAGTGAGLPARHRSRRWRLRRAAGAAAPTASASWRSTGRGTVVGGRSPAAERSALRGAARRRARRGSASNAPCCSATRSAARRRCATRRRQPERVRALVLENAGGLEPVGRAGASRHCAAMARFFAAGARGAWWFPRAYAAVLPDRCCRGRRRPTQRAASSPPAPQMAPLLARRLAQLRPARRRHPRPRPAHRHARCSSPGPAATRSSPCRAAEPPSSDFPTRASCAFPPGMRPIWRPQRRSKWRWSGFWPRSRRANRRASAPTCLAAAPRLSSPPQLWKERAKRPSIALAP